MSDHQPPAPTEQEPPPAPDAEAPPTVHAPNVDTMAPGEGLAEEEVTEPEVTEPEVTGPEVTEPEIAEPDQPPDEAGDPRVRSALGRLTPLDELDVEDHVPVYDAVHRDLQDALADAADEPGSDHGPDDDRTPETDPARDPSDPA